MAAEIVMGGGLFDRTRPLVDGRVLRSRTPYRYLPMSSVDSTRRTFGNGELDAGEVSFAAYLQRRDAGLDDYVAMPVFLSRAFRHGAIYAHGDSGMSDLSQLAGMRIGMPDYRHTTPIWVRGMLQDEYGVDWREVRWHVATPEGIPAGPSRPPRIESVAPGESLWQLLADKRLDAVVTMQRPPAEFVRDGRIVPILRDFEAAERLYNRKTGCFPVVHIVALRASLLALRPDAVADVYGAFDEARRLAIEEIDDIKTYAISLPWLPAHAAASRGPDGSELWSYGAAANRASIEPFERYCFEQGFTQRRFSVDEMFPGDYA